MKIAIYGAGSSYTPEIIKELSTQKEAVPVNEIVLYDIDPRRLEIQHGFCQRFARRLGLNAAIAATTDRHAALSGADFVITQYRVGGNVARTTDEKIPMKHGFIGQETTGPGGMMKAFRTIPVAIDLGRAMERECPGAWLINYTNPSGMITEAVLKYTKAKIIGLCAGGIRPAQQTARALGVPQASVRYDFYGLNHLNFAYNITVDGRALTREELNKVLASRANEATERLVEAYGLFPSGYLQYYFRTSKQLEKLTAAPQTRGERVQDLEKIIFAAYADPARDTVPEELAQRGGGGYSEVAIGLLASLWNNRDHWMVCNVPNAGTIKGLPEDAVIETGCLVNASGAHPLPQPNPPKFTWGLVAAVKNYEQLAIEAAATGDRDLALAALVAHPLVRDVDRAIPMLDEMLEANRAYLPQFFLREGR